MGLKEAGLRGSLRNVSVGASAIADSVVTRAEDTDQPGSPNTNTVGLRFETSQEWPQFEAKISSLTEPASDEEAVIEDTGGTELAVLDISSNVGGDVVTFNTPLQANTIYYIYIRSTNNRNYGSASVTYPITSADGNLSMTGRYVNGSADTTGVAYAFVSLGNVSGGGGGGSGGTTVYDSLSNLSYQQSFDLSTNSGNAGAGVWVRDDGSQLWVVNREPSPQTVDEYALSTAWDVSTASYVQSEPISEPQAGALTPTIADSGNKMFVCDLNSTIHEYDLTTSYDVSTASFVQDYTVTYQTEEHPLNIDFYEGGSSALIGMGQEDDIVQYSLSTPYDISTLSQVTSYDVQQDTGTDKLGGVRIRNSDQDVFIVEGASTNNAIYHYSLSTAGDLSTISFDESYDLSLQTNAAQDLAIKPDGTAIIVSEIDPHNLLEFRT